jgi:excisionase family DNA binding protein
MEHGRSVVEPTPACEQRNLLAKASEAATILRIRDRTLWKLTQRGKIECVRIDRSVRYSSAYLEEWVRSKSSANRGEQVEAGTAAESPRESVRR